MRQHIQLQSYDVTTSDTFLKLSDSHIGKSVTTESTSSQKTKVFKLSLRKGCWQNCMNIHHSDLGYTFKVLLFTL